MRIAANGIKNVELKRILLYLQGAIFCHWYSIGYGECLLDKPNGRIHDQSSQREQTVGSYVWSWITSVSLFGKKNSVPLFKNYHKVVVRIYLKI